MTQDGQETAISTKKTRRGSGSEKPALQITPLQLNDSGSASTKPEDDPSSNGLPSRRRPLPVEDSDDATPPQSGQLARPPSPHAQVASRCGSQDTADPPMQQLKKQRGLPAEEADAASAQPSQTQAALQGTAVSGHGQDQPVLHDAQVAAGPEARDTVADAEPQAQATVEQLAALPAAPSTAEATPALAAGVTLTSTAPPSLDELLQLIRGHPDTEAAVAAALNAVQRLKRAAPSNSTDSHPGAATKRAATQVPPALGGTSAQQLLQLRGRLPTQGDTGAESALRAAPDDSHEDSGHTGQEHRESKARKLSGQEPAVPSLSHLSLHSEQQQDSQRPAQQGPLFVAGQVPAGHPGSAVGGSGSISGQGRQGKGKKAGRNPTSELNTGQTPAPGNKAWPVSSGVVPATTPAGMGPTHPDALALTTTPTTTTSNISAAIPDMTNYLDHYPLAKQLMHRVRCTPNNSTKTPLALVNEYAARLTMEVVWQEDSDSAAGPYTATLTLQGRSTLIREASGIGRGRNKRDARQVAAAACMECLLGPEHGLTLTDFIPPAKPPALQMKRDSRPGLGFNPGNKFSGVKKQREDDLGYSGHSLHSSQSGGGSGGAAGSSGVRPVNFTRALLPSSIPNFARREPDNPHSTPRPSTSSHYPQSHTHMPAHPTASRSYHGGSTAPMDDTLPYHTPHHAYNGQVGPRPPPAPAPSSDYPSTLSMHSLQAILPAAASEVLANLHHKRDYNTAILGDLGTRSPLDMSGLQGSLDATGIGAAAAAAAAAMASHLLPPPPPPGLWAALTHHQQQQAAAALASSALAATLQKAYAQDSASLSSLHTPGSATPPFPSLPQGLPAYYDTMQSQAPGPSEQPTPGAVGTLEGVGVVAGSAAGATSGGDSAGFRAQEGWSPWSLWGSVGGGGAGGASSGAPSPWSA